MIGSRFKVHFVQNKANQITVTLTVDDECDLHFTMIGQYDYSADLQRYTMHYFRMNPPECYKCAACGLYGDFKGYQMQTCDGNTVTYGGYTNAWDERGWTWEKTYTNEFCEVTDDPEATPSPTSEPYVPPPDPTFPYDPCDDESSTLKQRANQECNEARQSQNDCCDKIGAVFCDDLMTNCAWDACFASEGDEDAIFDLVAAIVTDPVEDECDELEVDEENYEEHQTMSPSQSPTAKCPTDCFTTPSPTNIPTVSPTPEPTRSPTDEPTKSPTPEPTKSPTAEPTPSPTMKPTHICPIKQEKMCCCPSCEHHSVTDDMLFRCERDGCAFSGNDDEACSITGPAFHQ